MRRLNGALRRLARDEAGATAIEYTLLAALVGAAAIFGFDMVGVALDGIFTQVDAAL